MFSLLEAVVFTVRVPGFRDVAIDVIKMKYN